MDEMKKLNETIMRLEKMIYPYYGISKPQDQIILFTGPKTGININGKGYPVGYSSGGWAEEQFIPYYGKITIVKGGIRSFDGIESSEQHWNKE